MAATAETVACSVFVAANNLVALDMAQAVVNSIDCYMVNHENPALYVLPGDVERATALLAASGLPYLSEATTVPVSEWPQDEDLSVMFDPEDYDGE